MAFGIAALLDDVAVLAKAAAASIDDVAAATVKTSSRALGIVVDDTAVIPGQIVGVDPSRELPIVWKIGYRSLINKALVLVVAMLLAWIAPWLLTPILMLGGTYLCFEAAEKMAEKVHLIPEETEENSTRSEDELVASATRTDLILSAEIMVLSMNEVLDKPFWERLIVLICVGLAITVGVYAVVALLIKIDDIGLKLQGKDSTKRLGTLLVKAMPVILNIITVIGMFAMLWVGGHILISGFAEFGWEWPHHLAETVSSGGGILGWLADTGVSLVFGLIWGLIVVGIVMLVKRILSGVKKER